MAIGLAATLLHFIMGWRGETHLTGGAVAPVFAIVGATGLISTLWFFRLPANAGDEMNGRVPARI